MQQRVRELGRGQDRELQLHLLPSSTVNLLLTSQLAVLGYPAPSLLLEAPCMVLTRQDSLGMEDAKGIPA